MWPERQKLYGHAFEIFALASSRDGKWIASSAKAKDAKYAEIFIWNLASSNPIHQKLKGHKYTAVQLEFSKDSKYLLSVGRDRIWCIYEITPEGFNLFQT